ncbi:peptidoglycan-binding domain-containing protein [Nocardiopsis alba]|uniref:peptidoglycan-binding domain-containing protein n=1 Tax=Nocardiopsis alba TaxID=53437 RepID=UPI003D75702A
MATTIDNRLNGPDGGTPSAATLAASAVVGTVGLENVDGHFGAGRARYDATQTLHGYTALRIDTSYQRIGTPRLVFALPASGSWWARWYVWMPRLQDAGLGINEVRWHAGFPDTNLGLVIHATAAGNVGTRLQSTDLAAAAINWDSETGNAVSTGQWWRIELSYDGGNFTSRVFPGHGTTTSRVHTWTSRDVGRTLVITGYRYRRGVTLRPGDRDATTGGAVSQMQRDLLELGYQLPQWGADGDYGQEATNAVIAFQQDHGYAVVDGIAGPETLSGIDLALRLEARGQGYPPSLYVSHAAVSSSGPLGPAIGRTDLVTTASGGVLVDGSVSARATLGPASTASGGVDLISAVQVRRHAVVTAHGGVGVGGSASAGFRTVGTTAEGRALVVGASSSTRGGTAAASGGATVSGSSRGTRHGRVTASGAGRVGGRAEGTRARAAIALDYSRGHVSDPFDVVDDDQGLVNDVTARRTDGAEYRVTVEHGRNSVWDPPMGVGRYQESIELNAAYDVQMKHHAGWRAHLGTYDDARYPSVTVNLAKYPGLAENVTSRESGDWLQVINPPPWLPPEAIDLLIEGTDERINVSVWDVTFNASSGGPWTVGIVEDPTADPPTGPREPNRADTASSVLVSAISESDTSLSVRTTAGPSWVDSVAYPTAFPLDVRVGGEMIRVTAISGTGPVQVFTVDRALNGIRKSHRAGTAVSLARTAVVGL